MEAVDQVEGTVLVERACQRALLRPLRQSKRRRWAAKIVDGKTTKRITLRLLEMFQRERVDVVRLRQQFEEREPRRDDLVLPARVQAARNDDRDLHVRVSELYSATVRWPIACQLSA